MGGPALKGLQVFRLIVGNLLVLLLLVMLAEVAARTFRRDGLLDCPAHRQVSETGCWGAFWENPPMKPSALSYGVLQHHEDLGYVPVPGADFVPPLDVFPLWNESRITIDSMGFRSNGKGTLTKKKATLLLAGDSFAFGYEVGNEETIAACVEGNSHYRVYNAGVPGYGAAQSVLRMEDVVGQPERFGRIDLAVLSLLEAEGFARDRLSFRSGFPKPALVKVDGHELEVDVVMPETLQVPGTKFFQGEVFPRLDQRIFRELSGRFWVFYGFYDALDLEKVARRVVTIEHSEAADLDAALEWNLRTFAALPVPRKLLLIQYLGNSEGLDDKRRAERAMILEEASRWGIPVVDMMEVAAFTETPLGDLYRQDGERWAHMSPFGNTVVCEALLAALATMDSKDGA